MVESSRTRSSGGTREAAMTGPSIPEGFDFTDPGLYVRRMPTGEFAELRRTAPVWWNPQRRGASGFDDEGYWVVTKHADVLEVSRDSELYSSQKKTAIIRHAQQVTEESLEMQRLIMLNLDPPLHTKVRAIVSRGFTPRAIGRLRETLAARAANIVKTAVTEGTGDFVTDVAAELPRRSSSATPWSWPRTGAPARATTSSPSWSTPSSTAAN